MEATLSYPVFKAKAIGAQPLATRVALSEIEVADENTLLYKGYPLNLGKGALMHLADILKMPKNFIAEFERLLGTQAKEKFLNFIKDAKAARKNEMITLVGNPITKAIVGIQKAEYMPYELFFETLEHMMNMRPFDIKDMTFSGSKIAVSATLAGGVFNVLGLDNEKFYPGFTFMNSVGGGAGIDNFIYRLVCGNGMIGKDPDSGGSGPLKFGGKDGSQSPEIFFRGIEDLAKHDFVPPTFSDNVARAMKTMASWNEVQNAASVLKRGSELNNDYVDHFVPVNKIRSELYRKGVEVKTLNAAQEKSIKTNVPIWDVVNGLTYFASHDMGFNLNPGRKLEIQKIAYDILAKPAYDVENVVGVSL